VRDGEDLGRIRVGKRRDSATPKAREIRGND